MTEFDYLGVNGKVIFLIKTMQHKTCSIKKNKLGTEISNRRFLCYNTCNSISVTNY